MASDPPDPADATDALDPADPVEPGVAGADDGDLLSGAVWWCGATVPGSRSGPDGLDDGTGSPDWLAATVPGTVAAALRTAGVVDPPVEHLDGQDWWYRCRFTGPSMPGAGVGWVLELDGLATLSDVWLNGRHLLRSESMFAPRSVPVEELQTDNELCIRFGALTPMLAERRARPRWKVKGITSQNLRWFRTTLLGRQAGWASVPAPVGPWRPVRLHPVAPVEVTRRRLRASCPVGDGPTSGTVTVELTVSVTPDPVDGSAPDAQLLVAGVTTPLQVEADGHGWRLSGSVTLDRVDRWWPHTHGVQPRYPVRARVAGIDLDLGSVGFRTVEADRGGGAFRILVNGVPVFCRGGCWYPVDPVGLQTTDAELESAVGLLRAGGANMVRLPGGTVYEDERFFEACDRAGVLVWQDAMLGPADPPADEDFLAAVADEVSGVLDLAAAHPSLAVLCGGQQLEQLPAMSGIARERWRSPVLDTVLPDLVAREAPGLVYVTSSPSGGDLPFQLDVGVCHYYGVGAYLLPLGDLRRASPRFVTEGLAFAVPPERVTFDDAFGGDLPAHRESVWKRAVHRDPGSWFDLEDVRDHYVEELFGVDVAALWRTDPERALDLGRAAVAEVVTAAVAEWRRPRSRCDGMLMIGWRDLRPGPGWGVVDSSGRAKAPWYALARSWAPLAVTCTDEGLNGLDIHVVNDTGAEVVGTLQVGLHTAAHTVESASCTVAVPARGATTVRAESLFDGFRDLSYAYRFGARAYELVTADLVSPSGEVRAGVAFLPGGPARELDPGIGLQAWAEQTDTGAWLLSVSTLRFAQYVQVDTPGFVASDSWFHLPPGGRRTVALQPEAGTVGGPSGEVRALNSASVGRISP